MPQEDPVRATIVDLPSLSVNFPAVPSPELSRDNVLSTLEARFDGGARGIAVEGIEGMGKTTVLSQFARRHPNNAISLFITASNKLSFDPDLILQDLLIQVNWILIREIVKPGPGELSALKSAYVGLQRKAKQQKTLYYFVVDGTEELDESRRAIIVQHFSDLLPVGVPQFRSLFSGDAEIYQNLFPRNLQLKPYILSLLGLEETARVIEGQGASDQQLSDLHSICRGIPGRVASVLRVLKSGMGLATYLEKAPSNSPEFFGAEWNQVPDSDESVKRILALLAHDPKPYTVLKVAETLSLDVCEVAEKMSQLSFLSVDPDSKVIHFASESLRKYIATRLADRKLHVQKLLIKKLLASPSSQEFILELPSYLEEAAEFQNLLNLLTPDHILEVLKRSESMARVDEAVQRGLRAAKRLEKDCDLLRFGIQSAVIGEFASAGIWVSEVEALAAMVRDGEALALANNAILWEDRLQFLSALAAGIWRRGDTVSGDLIAQIRSLIDRTDARSLRRRVHTIASHLVCVSPDLATAVLDEVKGPSAEENDLDHAFLHVSLETVGGIKDEKRRDELLQNISLISLEPQMQSLFSGLRTLSGDLSSGEIRSAVDAIPEASGKMGILRAWCALNADHPEAGCMAEYALDTALETTAYTIDASVLADLSKPIPNVADDQQRRSLISKFDALSRIAVNLGPSIKYVDFQLSLALAEAPVHEVGCEERLTALLKYINQMDDLPSKAEALATVLGALVSFDTTPEFAARLNLEKSCLSEIETIVLRLSEATADHYLAFKGVICALSARHLDKALEYTRLVNTEVRRDEILADVITTLIDRPAAEVKPFQLIQVLNQIKGRRWKDDALETIMERFKDTRTIPADVLDGLNPIILDLNSISDSISACESLVSGFNLLARNPSPTRDETRALVWSQIITRWSHIDVGWSRIDVGFTISNAVAGTCKEYAALVFKQAEELKERWGISAYEPASAYVGLAFGWSFARSGDFCPRNSKLQPILRSWYR